MRRLSLSIMALLLTGCAELILNPIHPVQPITDSERTFEKVIQAQGFKKDQIYDGSKAWIKENLRSSKGVIEFENKEAGTIVANGSMKYPCARFSCLGKEDWVLDFTMRVDVKDRRFKLLFSDLLVSWPPSPSRPSGAQPANHGPVQNRADLYNIKTQLLGFGDEILASMRDAQEKARKKEW
jgi:hypothetical protein